MDHTERALGEVTNELRKPPQHFVSEEGRLFVAGTGAIKAPTKRSIWPPLIFVLGLSLFGTFLIAHNTGTDLSVWAFMLTAIGGFAMSLIGGIAFVVWATTKPVLRDATHLVEGKVTRVKRMRNTTLLSAQVRFRSPSSGRDRKANFIVLPEQRNAVGNGTTVAVLFAEDHDAGVVI